LAAPKQKVILAVMYVFIMPHSESSLSGRDAARPIIAKTLKTKSEYLEYDETSKGKPILKHFEGTYCGFSHSNKILALYLGPWDGGIDIEYAREDRDFVSLGKYMFSEKECLFLQADPFPPRRFYTLWTAKEAWLKAKGLSAWDLAQAPELSDFETLKTEGFFHWRLRDKTASGKNLDYILCLWLPKNANEEGLAEETIIKDQKILKKTYEIHRL